MRKLLSFLILALAAAPAFAEVNEIPEPGIMALLAVGVAGLVVAKRRK